MSKYYLYPFAFAGDKTVVPNDAQPDNRVSFDEGYTPEYELDQETDPSALDVEREKQNQLFFDITENIRNWQTFGIYQHITAAMNDGVPYPYPVNALCLGINGIIYESKTAANTQIPPGVNWNVVSDFGRIANLNILSGVPVNATNLGVFTGTIIPDAQNIKEAIQSLETRAQNIITPDLADGAVTTAKLGNDSVTAAKIGANQVGASEINASSITTAKITTSAVTTVKIADAAVTTAKIADGNVGVNKLADGAVSNIKLANDAVSQDKVQNDTIGQNELISASVGQAELKTSTGGGTIISQPGNQLMPGGTYGFYPITRVIDVSGGGNLRGLLNYSSGQGALACMVGSDNVGGGNNDLQWSQRYMSASPPFTLGHGDIQNFTYVHMKKNGKILGIYSADVPPWAYNGPTNIRPDSVEKVYGSDGVTVVGTKKFIHKLTQPVEPWNGGDIDLWDLGPQIEKIEIDHNIKNADMHLFPHPFVDAKASDIVVLLEPSTSLADRLTEINNSGGEGWNLVRDGFINIGSEIESYSAPLGVKVVTANWKNT